MKKRFFDVGLYLDGLRQLKIVGVMLFVILELEAILIPLGQYIAILQRLEYSPSAVYNMGVVNFLQMHPLLVLTFTVFAPVMMLYLFSFLNKRNSSDFYHSLPNTRLSLFFSFFAAVMTWVIAASVISSLTAVAGHLLLSQYCSINFTSVWVMLFNMLAASFFTAAAVGMAMCLSGTVFTNLVVSLLLIFMPRVLILIFTSYLSSVLSILSPEHFIPPLDGQYNVATNLVLGLFTGSAEQSFTFFTGGLYTLGLGLLYTVFAALLFRARKSESAGQSAPNRALQTVYRCLIAMLVCLVPCTAIVANVINHESPSGEDVFVYLVFYIGAVLLYFIYEIITTRKWRNLARAVPALGILALCNLAFIGGVLGAYNSVLSFHPGKDDIEYVRLLGTEGSSSNNYFSLKVANAPLDDPVIREVIANRLQVQTEQLRKNPGSRNWYYDGMINGGGTYQTVAIRTGMRTVYRRLNLTTEDNRLIGQSFANNEEVRTAYTTLPQLGKNATNVGVSNLSGAQAEEVYKVFLEEAAAMDFADWYLYLQTYGQAGAGHYGYYEYTDDRVPATLRVSTSIGTSSAYLNLPLTSQFPRSVNLFLQYANQAGDIPMLLQQLAERNWRMNDSIQLRFYDIPKDVTGGNSEFYLSGSDLFDRQEKAKALAEALLKYADEPVTIDKPLMYITLYLTESSRDHDVYAGSYEGWVNVPEDALPLLRDFLNIYQDSNGFETDEPQPTFTTVPD